MGDQREGATKDSEHVKARTSWIVLFLIPEIPVKNELVLSEFFACMMWGVQ